MTTHAVTSVSIGLVFGAAGPFPTWGPGCLRTLAWMEERLGVRCDELLWGSPSIQPDMRSLFRPAEGWDHQLPLPDDVDDVTATTLVAGSPGRFEIFRITANSVDVLGTVLDVGLAGDGAGVAACQLLDDWPVDLWSWSTLLHGGVAQRGDGWSMEPPYDLYERMGLRPRVVWPSDRPFGPLLWRTLVPADMAAVFDWDALAAVWPDGSRVVDGPGGTSLIEFGTAPGQLAEDDLRALYQPFLPYIAGRWDEHGPIDDD